MMHGKSAFVQTQGTTIELVTFTHDETNDEYLILITGKDDWLKVKKSKRARVQFEDGDWYTIQSDSWVCIHMGYDLFAGNPYEFGVCAVASTPALAFESGFNLYF